MLVAGGEFCYPDEQTAANAQYSAPIDLPVFNAARRSRCASAEGVPFSCQGTITMTSQRTLSVANLDQITTEVDRLLAGHVTVGEWSLGQICHHLALALHGARRVGRCPRPPPSRRRCASDSLRQVFPQAPGACGHAAESRSRRAEEAERLRRAIEHFKQSQGPYPAHPALGPLDREEWLRFHCMHAAHRLGFAGRKHDDALSESSRHLKSRWGKGHPQPAPFASGTRARQ